MHVSNPFTRTPQFANTSGQVGDGTFWPIGFDLKTIMYLFYQVANFKVQMSGFGLGAGLGIGDILGSTNVAANGLSKRQIKTAPDENFQVFDAERNASQPDATQKQIDLAKSLRSKVTKNHITTEGQYPVHIFAGSGGLVKIDFGQVRRLGEIYFPRIEITAGTDFQNTVGAYAWGIVSLALPNGSKYPITVYANGLGSLSGTISVEEVYSDLQLSKSFGPSGAQITIGLPSDTKKKFTGFKSIKYVSFDGYKADFQFQIVNGNETCSVTIPPGARSNYLTFISEDIDGFVSSSGTDYTGKRYNQFTLPTKYIVND